MKRLTVKVVKEFCEEHDIKIDGCEISIIETSVNIWLTNITNIHLSNLYGELDFWLMMLNGTTYPKPKDKIGDWNKVIVKHNNIKKLTDKL